VESVIVNLGSDVTVASYEYLGAGQVATQTLDAADQTNSFHSSGAFGIYLDRYNRVIRHQWTRSAGAGISQQFDVSYDNNSNILLVKDPSLAVFDGTNWDNVFSMKVDVDNRNRVTRADRGEESSGSITGTTRLNQLWSLSQTGNWTNFKNDLDGDSNGTDAGETNEDRTFSDANEILTRVIAGPITKNVTHDKAGQMTFDGNDFIFTYDAWGRVVKVDHNAITLGTSGRIAEYKYNGLGQRIGWHYDVSGDGDVTTADPWYWFVLDDKWRIVSTYRVVWSSPNWVPDGDTRAKERFVHHAAGFDGQGGSSYIDALILSDRDNSSGWTSQGAQTLEERYYYLQNWRNDLCALTNDGGVIVRRFRYSAYGARTEIAAADYDADGGVDAADSTTWNTDYAAPNNRADVNHDGAVDYFDYLDFVAITATDGDDLAGGKTRNLYAGYENDPALEVVTSAGGGLSLAAYESIYHVRYRVFSTELGRWTRRDPLGYVDGMGLEEYCAEMPLLYIDVAGKAASFAMLFDSPATLPETEPTPGRRPSDPGRTFKPNKSPIIRPVPAPVVPAEPAPSHRPRVPIILTPLGQCVAAGVIGYLIGDFIYYQWIDEHISWAGSPHLPRTKFLTYDCEYWEKQKTIACGKRYSKDKNLPKLGYENSWQRIEFCHEIRQRRQNAMDCLVARLNVDTLCYQNIDNSGRDHPGQYKQLRDNLDVFRENLKNTVVKEGKIYPRMVRNFSIYS
jgi:RHS repeat-associated protein